MTTKKAGLAIVGVLLVVLAVLIPATISTDNAIANNNPPCEPQEAYTETTDWVLESPGEGWYLVDERTVVDVEGVEGVDQWYHWNGSNQADPPPWPNADFNTDNGNHTGLENKPDYAPNKVFDASVLGGDNASWFYHELIEAVEEITHQEYKYAFDHPAVECPPPCPEEDASLTTTTSPIECPEIEVFAAVTAVQPNCDNQGIASLIFDRLDAIEYDVEGVIAPGETVQVTAHSILGFLLVGQFEFEITFDTFDASTCNPPPPPPPCVDCVPPPPPPPCVGCTPPDNPPNEDKKLPHTV